MFWKKKQMATKLPGPKGIADVVARYIIVGLKQDPDWVWHLKNVIRPRSDIKDRFDVRVFDMSEAARKKVVIQDYTSLDEHPELILFEGWFDKNLGAEIKDKRGKA